MIVQQPGWPAAASRAGLAPMALRPAISRGLPFFSSRAGLPAPRAGLAPMALRPPVSRGLPKESGGYICFLRGPASPPGPPVSISAPPLPRPQRGALSCRKRQDKTGVLLFRPQFGRAFRIGRQAAASIARRTDRLLPGGGRIPAALMQTAHDTSFNYSTAGRGLQKSRYKLAVKISSIGPEKAPPRGRSVIPPERGPNPGVPPPPAPGEFRGSYPACTASPPTAPW